MYRRNGETSWDAQASTGVAGAGGNGAAQVADRARTPWRVAPGDSRMAQMARRPRTSDSLPTVNIDGVEFHAITEQQCIAHILDELDAGRGGTVVTPNLDHLRRYTRDLTFGALVAEAELVVADGMPIIWASRLQRTPLPQRVAGSDLISSLSAAASKRGKSVFLLGGDEGTAEAGAKILAERDPSPP
jgi:UDP-N-acetyl-D-mannosaminuronic acid transferase (WecB/TagA/CpsF family)